MLKVHICLVIPCIVQEDTYVYSRYLHPVVLEKSGQRVGIPITKGIYPGTKIPILIQFVMSYPVLEAEEEQGTYI